MTNEARWDVEIDGVGFLVDTGGDVPPLSHRTVPLLQRQFDTGTQTGETSLNPEGPWRRSIETWHRGAGQVDQDGADSFNGQFYDSFDVDPWVKGELRPLNTTEDIGTRQDILVSTPLGVFGVGLATDDTINLFDEDGTITDTVTISGANIFSMAWDGTSLFYASTGVAGIFRIDSALTTEVNILAETGDLYYANGRLLLVYSSTTTTLHDLSAISYDASPAALPTAIFTLPSAAGINSVTDGQGYIYIGSSNGTVYRTTVKDDGSGLDVPTTAATLPNGENLTLVYGYLGFVLIGTSRGYRLAKQASDGSLTLGETISDDSNLSRTAVGFGRFIYATAAWTVGAAGPAIIRIDLAVLNDTKPAYAVDYSKLPSDGNQPFQMVVFNDRLFFSTATEFYRVTDTASANGWIETGEIDFGLSDNKIAKGLIADLASGTVSFDIITDAGTTSVGSVVYPDRNLDFPADIAAGSFRVKAYLSADAVLRSFTLLGVPTGVYTDEFTVPLRLSAELHQSYGDQIVGFDSTVASTISASLHAQLLQLRTLRDAGAYVAYVEGGITYSVQITSVDFLARSWTDDRYTYEGSIVVKMKSSSLFATSAAAGTVYYDDPGALYDNPLSLYS